MFRWCWNVRTDPVLVRLIDHREVPGDAVLGGRVLFLPLDSDQWGDLGSIEFYLLTWNKIASLLVLALQQNHFFFLSSQRKKGILLFTLLEHWNTDCTQNNKRHLTNLTVGRTWKRRLEDMVTKNYQREKKIIFPLFFKSGNNWRWRSEHFIFFFNFSYFKNDSLNSRSVLVGTFVVCIHWIKERKKHWQYNV